MKRSSPSLRSRAHHLKAYRPVIELLERRLPPGSLFSSLLLGGSTLALEIEKNGLDEAVPALRRVEKPDLIREIWRPELVATEASDIAVAHEYVPRKENPTLDVLQVGASSNRPPAFRLGVAMQRPAAMEMASSALTAPAAGRAAGSAIFGRVQLTAPQMATGGAATKPADLQASSEAQDSEVLDNYGKLPLSFEQNVGQFDERVDFVSRGGGSTLFLTPTAAVFAMQKSESGVQNSESSDVRAGGVNPLRTARFQGVDTPRSPEARTGVALHMQIAGGNNEARATATDKLPGITNYFIGNDPTQWRTNIASFGRVEYDEVYPGIDLAYYGNNGQLEYDFIVSPGADPSAIALNFAGADGMEINPQGDLVVHTAAGDVVQQKPFTYQQVGNGRQEVASGYVMVGNTIRFQVGNYDQSQPLVIDPLVLGYSTILGELAEARKVAVDSTGSAYVTGYASSGGFPITPGAFDATFNGPGYDAFVTKLNAAGSGLVYSTFLGGSGTDVALGIAVDISGSAYVTGVTESNDFPITVGAFDTTNNGGTYNQDGFITKLNAGGSALGYSTFFGGSGDEWSRGIAVDGAGNAYVTGHTSSPNFPITPGAFDATLNYVIDAFVTKLNASGSALAYSTYLGGTGFENFYQIYEGDPGIAVDGSGNAYVTGNTNAGDFPTTPGAFDTTIDIGSGGEDAFVTKLNAAGSALIYSTFLGGSADDDGVGIALDSSGNAYVTGRTKSSNFPTTPGAFDTSYSSGYDTFVTKLNSDGSALIYSTFLGGYYDDYVMGIAVDGSGNAYVTGWTNSWNFPATPGALDTTLNIIDAFVTKLNAAGSALAYSSLMGGSDWDQGSGIAVDSSGNVYMTGWTGSNDFPTTPGAFDTALNASYGGFVTKFRVAPPNCGCFEAHTISTAANGAYSVFAADIDGDGDTDVLAAEHFDAKIAWYENNGSQSFTAHTITPAAFGAVSVFAADVDSDGDTDVLSASRLDNKIAWYKNSGGANPSFTAHTITTTAADARSVYAADVDGDGDMDVLSASALDDKIAWYRNNGSESFTLHTITTAANGARSVITADVDRDGDTDVLSASYYDNKIAWYENNGGEAFTAHTITTAASGAESVFTADVDGDGDIDVLSASIVDNKIAWYRNDGNQNFTAHVITTTFVNLPKDVFAADIDADGDINVLSASVVDNKIAWYKNDGGVNPSFTAHTITTAAVGAVSVMAADVDSDGDTDVLSASANDDKIAWYENHSFTVVNTNDSGSGSLRQAILTANANPGVDTITFDIGSGVQTIAPTSALPAITDPVVIDGTTQPGYVDTPLVVLSADNTSLINGLHVTAGNSTIKGLVINGFQNGILLGVNGGNLVVGNYIGTDATGTVAVKNSTGISLYSVANTIGGATAASRNLISGNGNAIVSNVSAASTVIQGNYIGTNAAGTSALGNLGYGVFLYGSNSLVGGTTPGSGNLIAFNGSQGVTIDGGIGNAISQNAIYSNGGLGIALTNGGNGNQNKPAVNLATSGGGTTTISATLVSTPSTTFTLDFFSSSVCDPSTFGEGETYLGSKTLTTKSTGRGRTIFVAGVEVPVGHVITATATSPGNNTSEFSKCWTVT